jgi:hypothetical protein
LRAAVGSGASTDEVRTAFDAVAGAASRLSPLETAHVAADLWTHGEDDLARTLSGAVLADPPPSKYDDRPDTWRALGLAQHAVMLRRAGDAERWIREATAALDGVMPYKAAETRTLVAGLEAEIALLRGDDDALEDALTRLAPIDDAAPDLGMRAFVHADALASAGRGREALARMDDAFSSGFAEPLAFHTSSLARILADDPAFRARLELYGMR